MNVTSPGDRGFRWLEHPCYPSEEYWSHVGPVRTRLAAESSAIGDYPDSLDRPGSSYLWIGDRHHLNREEVAEFVECLQKWLSEGRLPPPSK